MNHQGLNHETYPEVRIDKLTLIPPAQDCPAIASRWGRYREILKHYDWRQLARRAGKLVFGRMGSRFRQPLSAPAKLSFVRPSQRQADILDLVLGEYAQEGPIRDAELRRGSIRLLNQTRSLGQPLDWDQIGDASHLWRFQLQYHEFLLPILARNPELVGQILASWLSRFATKIDSRSDAWHPYCISRRAQAWCWILSKTDLPNALARQLAESLFQQIEYLAGNLEWDPGGNHLLENLLAICLTRCFLKTHSDEFRSNRMSQRLVSVLPQQILEHGEHFERSPMYHSHILSRLLLLIGLSPEGELSGQMQALRDIAKRMLTFLNGICHPDGEFPMFGDSGFGETLSTPTVRQLALRVGLSGDSERELWVGPYWMPRTDHGFLVVDTGDVAAPHLPAHGHCDLLGWEGSIEGSRWFVDSGNFDYDDGPMRRYCRSSLAHNVATMDRLNHCRVWSKFRMGKRAKVWERRSGEDGDLSWIWVRHDSLCDDPGPNCGRLMVVQGDKWVCADVVPPQVGERRLEGWLHIAPDLRIEQKADFLFQLEMGTARRYLRFFGVAEVELFQAWHCPRFGDRQANVALAYRFLDGAPTTGWSLSREDSFSIEIVDRGLGWQTSDEHGKTKTKLWDFKQCILS